VPLPAPNRPDDAPETTRAVTVPPGLTGPLLRVLVRALTREVREDGGVVPPGIAVFLRALQAAVDGPPVADDGNAEDRPETIEIAEMATVAELAEHTGHPARTLRHWAATGRVRAYRAGRVWLIDPGSLKNRT
jgi:excisionase family DNA binding protein